MSHSMAADFFARSPLLALPIVGLVLCLTIYVAAAIRAFCVSRRELERMARLPLEPQSEVDDV